MRRGPLPFLAQEPDNRLRHTGTGALPEVYARESRLIFRKRRELRANDDDRREYGVSDAETGY